MSTVCKLFDGTEPSVVISWCQMFAEIRIHSQRVPASVSKRRNEWHQPRTNVRSDEPSCAVPVRRETAGLWVARVSWLSKKNISLTCRNTLTLVSFKLGENQTGKRRDVFLNFSFWSSSSTFNGFFERWLVYAASNQQFLYAHYCSSNSKLEQTGTIVNLIYIFFGFYWFSSI